MSNRIFLLCALFIAAISFSNPVLAWGQKGHRLSGIIAQDLLTDSARANLIAIMGSDDLGTLSLYLDEHKIRLANSILGSRKWHYDNEPICQPGIPKSKYCPGGDCASEQIARHYNILLNGHSTVSERRFAILVLTHLIGDIHQPLHAADNGDRGGNGIKIKLPWSRAKKNNLHSTWDTEFIERMYKGKDERVVARQLFLDYQVKVPAWRDGRERAWLTESHQIAKEVVYGRLSGFVCATDFDGERVDLSDEYTEEAKRIIPEQLVKAGVRMALLLNRALDK